jgi:hypothetical protein
MVFADDPDRCGMYSKEPDVIAQLASDEDIARFEATWDGKEWKFGRRVRDTRIVWPVSWSTTTCQVRSWYGCVSIICGLIATIRGDVKKILSSTSPLIPNSANIAFRESGR